MSGHDHAASAPAPLSSFPPNLFEDGERLVDERLQLARVAQGLGNLIGVELEDHAGDLAGELRQQRRDLGVEKCALQIAERSLALGRVGARVAAVSLLTELIAVAAVINISVDVAAARCRRGQERARLDPPRRRRRELARRGRGALEGRGAVETERIAGLLHRHGLLLWNPLLPRWQAGKLQCTLLMTSFGLGPIGGVPLS
mmetsp:Transcript_7672/g.15041  ORF Transcript_7672/g.15041 Transcript_7672/m.15041 type:complete len:201 (+) Transcript_7672:64-666(+)